MLSGAATMGKRLWEGTMRISALRVLLLVATASWAATGDSASAQVATAPAQQGALAAQQGTPGAQQGAPGAQQGAAVAPRRPNYPVEAANTTCPRAKLEALVDAYSAAMAAHDPKKVGLAAKVRFTENAEILDAGKSTLWKGAGPWKLRNDLIDTQRCGTVSWGVIEENGRPVHVAIRLQTNSAGAVTEAEHIIAREQDFFYGPDAVLATSYLDWETILPPNERASREAMTAAANDYFEEFNETHYVSVPYADRCDRWENSIKTTRTHDCKPPARGENSHPARRIPLVDLEAGTVAAFVHFRRSLVDVHVLKMQRGQVAYMMAIVGPKAESGGWPVGDGK
jgi:hypothetical protein